MSSETEKPPDVFTNCCSIGSKPSLMKFAGGCSTRLLTLTFLTFLKIRDVKYLLDAFSIYLSDFSHIQTRTSKHSYCALTV